MGISRAFFFAKFIRNTKQIAKFFEIADTSGTIDSFTASTYPAARYIITAMHGTDVHTTEILVHHNGSSADMTEYGTLYTDGALATYNVELSLNVVRLKGTPLNSNTDFNFQVQYVEA